MHIHFVIHEVFEAPGAYLEWAQKRKHTAGFSRVYENQPLPEAINPIDMLIVMGGPQSPDTTLSQCPHFDASAEINLIKKCIAAGKAVIGICLGAQLTGEALGARYEHSPEKEIGVYPIQLTEKGLQHPSFKHFGSPLPVGHWHNDMPGLTPASKIIATSHGCPRQIVEYTDLVYGFQCHMEFNAAVIEPLIASEEELLVHNTTHRFVQQPDEIRSYDFSEMNEKLFQFLDMLSAEYMNR
ncbi:type 1 glutamine amidotransferase [Chitinophaga sp. HK235]|uniref:type 1 glutamine amidotransferase n=1 Tax=Chitinophaga sp. HK235 TaxID=2952571 RepID=UPI001BA45005|nr:type 1 glutamine amidotransferase [Chitinophaga sp. HK235]